MHRMILGLAVLVVVPSCRDHLSVGGERLGDQHVLAGRPDADGGATLSLVDLRRGWFGSTDAALEPLRDYLRSEVRVTGDLRSSLVVSTSGGASLTLPIAQVFAERQALCDAGVLAFCRTVDVDALNLLDHVTLDLLASEIAVRWSDERGQPQIVVTLPFVGDLDPPDWFPSDPPGGRLDIELAIVAWPISRGVIDPDTGPWLEFDRYYGPGRHVWRVGGIEVELRGVTVTGFAATIAGVDVAAAIRANAGAVVESILDVCAPLVAMRWLAPPPRAADVFDDWCATVHPGGCPLDADAVEALRWPFVLDVDLRGAVYRRGAAAVAPSGPPFDDRHLEVFRLGGYLDQVRLQLDIARAEASCRRPESEACRIVAVCAAPPSPPIAALCSGREQRVSYTAANSPFVMPAVPLLAQVAAAAPGLFDQLQRVFWEPALVYNRGPGPDVVVSAIAMCPGRSACPDGAVGPTFVFPVDDDRDGVPFVDDNCPDVASADTTDTDHDGRGDACDPCPLVVGWSGGDRDGDGTPDLCDCDIDGDTCANPIAGFDGAPLCAATGAVFDQVPRVANPPDVTDHDRDGDVGELVDWDGDGAIDDCDADDDGDGVVDADDNCHWVANPDQRDSGGTLAGDACDAVCATPGAAGCTNPFGLPAIDWFDGALLRAYHPALSEPPLCLVDGPGCGLLVAIDPVDPAVLVLTSALGAPAAWLRADEFGFGVKELGARASADLDGDGRDELLLALPQTGEVVAYDPFRRKLLWRLAPLGAGGVEVELGAAMVVADGALWVGAPGADSGRGAVAVVGLGLTPGVKDVRWGTTAGERYGAALAAGPGEGVLVVAARAKRTDGTAAGRVDWVSGGATLISFPGFAAEAGADTRAVAVDAGFGGDPGVVVLAPAASQGRGQLVAYKLDGSLRWKLQGGAGERLGASAQPVMTTVGLQLLVGAPGAGAGGTFYLVSASGHQTLAAAGATGAALGGWVQVGDVTGDGTADVLLGARPTVLLRGKR